jgi:hypothetical protein
MGWENYSYKYTLDSNGNTLSSSAKVPVCVAVCTQEEYTVYNVENPDKPIVLGNWQTIYHNFTDWKIVSSRVQLVRYYAASTAKITLATDILDLNGIIPPPGLSYSSKVPELNASNYDPEHVVTWGSNSTYKEKSYELRPEMKIEIFMGYINKFESVEKYITKSADNKFVLNPKVFSKVFNGIIDSVELKLGRGENPQDGITCTVIARDHLRFLIDNKFFGSLKVPKANLASTSGVSRNEIMRALIVQGSAGACTPGDTTLLFHPSGRPPMKLSGLMEKDIQGSKNGLSVLGGVGVPFSIADQFPVDALRWFSLVETIPRELYCDIESGKIAWTIRSLGEAYKTQPDGNLFGELETFQESVNIDDGTLPEDIIYNQISQISRPNVSFDLTDATSLYSGILGSYSGSELPAGYEHWFFGFLQEISDNFDVFKGSSLANVGYILTSGPGNPIYSSNNNGNQSFIKGESGFTEIDLTKQDDPLEAVGQTALRPIDYSNYTIAEPSTLIPRPVFLYVRESAKKLKKLYETSWQEELSSLSTLVSQDIVTIREALRIAIKAYKDASPKALSLALSSSTAEDKLTYEKYEKFLKDNPAPEPGETRINMTNVQSYAAAFYRPLKLKSSAKTDGRDALFSSPNTNEVERDEPISFSELPVGINILRGESDPWVYTYKRQAKNKSGATIQPNIISAHASWMTLGMITKFTLLNPSATKGSGGVGVRVSHSLRGNPFGALGTIKEVNKQNLVSIWKNTDGIIDAGEVVDPADAAALNRATFDFSSRDINLRNYNLSTSMADINGPLKFLSKIRYPVRHRYFWDETGDSKTTDVVADLILNAMMSIYSRDVHSVDLLVPLNPDIRPGHVLETHNLGYFNGDQFRIEGVIHMFASGGVQNGCTTMLVGVSKEGSQDPVKARKLLVEVIKLQNLKLADALKLPTDSSQVQKDAEQISSTTRGQVAANACRSLDFRPLRNINANLFATLVDRISAYYPRHVDQCPVTTQFLRYYGQNTDNTIVNLTENLFNNTYGLAGRVFGLEDAGVEENINVRDAYRKHLYSYCFNWLASTGGEITSYDDYQESNINWDENYGVNYEESKKQFTVFLRRFADCLNELRNFIDNQNDLTEVNAFINQVSSGLYPDEFFRAIHQSGDFNNFIETNKPIIKFRAEARICPQSIGLMQTRFNEITRTGIDYTLALLGVPLASQADTHELRSSAEMIQNIKDHLESIMQYNYNSSQSYFMGSRARVQFSYTRQFQVAHYLIENPSYFRKTPYYTANQRLSLELAYSYCVNAHTYFPTRLDEVNSRLPADSRVRSQNNERMEQVLAYLRRQMAAYASQINANRVGAKFGIVD